MPMVPGEGPFYPGTQFCAGADQEQPHTIGLGVTNATAPPPPSFQEGNKW